MTLIYFYYLQIKKLCHCRGTAWLTRNRKYRIWKGLQ